MKNFLKIFIFLEIILLAYIFNTSIYNIYEKNNIATEKLEGYVLEETSPEILDKFYTIFTEKYSQNKLELINNTLTSTDKSVYDLYCYPLNEFTQKQPISSSILFQYHELQKEDFLDSVGVFYTDLPVNAIKEIASQLSVTINTFENDAIPYSMVLELNLLNGLQISRPYYEQQLVIANRNYLSEFSNIQFSGKPLGENIFSEPTVLVPHKYKLLTEPYVKVFHVDTILIIQIFHIALV